jgi:hypothetical protein
MSTPKIKDDPSSAGLRREDGGPAFPRLTGNTLTESVANTPQEGMSLRDYFAASIINSVIVAEAHVNTPVPWGNTCEGRAEWSYKQADALIAARKP